MGCTFSGHRGDNNVRSFRVYNVDDQGMELNRGRLEIRDTELVLYQKGKEPIRWPLRWLRRYGCDDELFSFESGRRCATGTGIFAFKCTHASTLFNLVHENLERAGEDDHRAQQQHLPLQHQAPIQQNAHTITSSQTRQQESIRQITIPEPPLPAQGVYLAVHNNSSEGDALDDVSPNGSAHLYVNGPITQDDDHQYINTAPPRSVSAAMQIDETAALVDFLHNPPMNYAVIELTDAPTSMENLLDESGQGAVHNMERHVFPVDGNNRLSQPNLMASGVRGDVSRLSMPNDLTAAASQETDSVLQSADSDVFLDASTEAQANANYVNVVLEDSAAHGASGAIPPPLNLFLPPTHEVPALNYANIQIQSPKQVKLVNYITIDHKAQSNDNLPSGMAGSGVSNSNTSPISPTSCGSFPDSPSRKTRSYATIDFDRTQALSNTTRPTGPPDEEGSRKTRHNSSISDMPS